MAVRLEPAATLLVWPVLLAACFVGCGGGALKHGGTGGDASPDAGPADAAADGGQPDVAADGARAPDVADAGAEATADVGAGPGKDAPAAIDAAGEKTPARDAGVEVAGPPCPVDCQSLPHVKPGGALCANGRCVLVGQPCQDGFAHCSNDSNDGCETDLSSPLSCGSCTNGCVSPYSACEPNNGTHVCSRVCAAPLPDSCNSECADFQNDVNNCGGCQRSCFIQNAEPRCVQGECQIARCGDVYGDCSASQPGCETRFGTFDNCAGCGDKACSIANTFFSCSSASSCTTALCNVGFGNCDRNPDCETPFEPGGACLPTYVGTTSIPYTAAVVGMAVAIGPDGSYFQAGGFSGTVDLDPTDGEDLHTADEEDAYITKLNPDGSYAWTRTLAGRGFVNVTALAAAPDGAIVAVGSYADSVDIDPGPGVDLRQTVAPSISDSYVLKLAADGSSIWARTFTAADPFSGDDATGVAVDATGSVFTAGTYHGTVDLDPTAGAAMHTSSQGAGKVVKLTSGGEFSWAATLDDMDCVATLKKIAIASDGALWTVGVAASGPDCLQSPAPTASNDMLIAAFEPAGSLRGTWRIGGRQDDEGWAVAAGSGGAVYVSGTSPDDMIDLDPGAGVAKRFLGQGGGGFILKLGSDGQLLWAHTTLNSILFSLATTDDGGVLCLSYFVTKLNADGSDAWSFVSGGDSTNPAAIAARGNVFAITGTHGLFTADFDPGPSTDILSGADRVYLSRFRF